MLQRPRLLRLLVLAILVLSVGCRPSGPLPSPLTLVTVPPTVTMLPSLTTPQPAATATRPSSTAVPPTLAPTRISPTQAPGVLTIQIMLIALGDNGKAGPKVGCGDSLVPVKIQIPRTQAVLRASLEALLAVKEKNYGQSGLYNALYQSDLRLEGVTIQDGRALVRLAGQLTLGGECDNPRVEAQLKGTALQFSTVHQVSVFVGAKPLDQVLSLK